MDIAKEIAQYLADNGFGTLGTDLFVSQIPGDTNGIYVCMTGGQMDNYLPVEEAVLDIYVKNSSASSAVVTLNSIKKFIHRMIDTSTPNAYIFAILALGNIETITRDAEYAKIYKLTLQIRFRDTSLIS